jgi:hypothetical protein
VSRATRYQISGGRHTGLTDRVRSELNREPQSITGIAERLGEDSGRVKAAVDALCDRLGGYAAVPWSPRTARLYASVEWIREHERAPVKHKGSGVFPVPAREREWKPLRPRTLDHMRLAMLTR